MNYDVYIDLDSCYRTFAPEPKVEVCIRLNGRAYNYTWIEFQAMVLHFENGRPSNDTNEPLFEVHVPEEVK